MGREFAQTNATFAKIVAKADEVLGYRLSSLCYEGPLAELTRTPNAQPAILTNSIALYRVFSERCHHRTDYMAGHSLGEYTALVAAGAMSFEETVRIVHHRGKYMESAVPGAMGAMAAVIGVGSEEIDDLCCSLSTETSRVAAANYNSPEQVVISGHKPAVEKVITVLGERGRGRVVPLAVSGPFHSELMRPVADRLAPLFAKTTFNDPEVPVITNVSAQPLLDRAEIAANLINQVYSPVRWEESMRYLLDSGVDTFIEIGAGRVLGRLMRKIERGARVLSVRDSKSMDDVLASL